MEINQTYLASVRTFEASLRTNAIFIGLSLLILDKHNKFYSKIIIILSLLINLILTIAFIIVHKNNFNKQISYEKYLYYSAPIFYSVLLFFIQLMILYFIHLSNK